MVEKKQLKECLVCGKKCIMSKHRKTCDSYCAQTYRFMSPSIKYRKLFEFNNKGSVISLFGIIAAFLFLTLFFVFISAFVYEIGDENVITPIHNLTATQANQKGLTQDIKDTIDKANNDYKNFIIPYDLWFLVGFISVFAGSLYTAYTSREESHLGFFGAITFGLIGFLYIFSFLITISDWFIENFIENFLDFSLTSTPILNFFLTNIGFIAFIWATLLIIINKFDFGTLAEKVQRGGNFEE